MSHRFKIGDLVERCCPSTIGHESIGEIVEDRGPVYWVRILVGRNGMQEWKQDAWTKSWCIPYLNSETPDWEV